MATYNITSGVSSSGLILNNKDLMRVSSGGSAVDTTVNSGGNMHVSSGGSADGVTVNSGGKFYVSVGGMVDAGDLGQLVTVNSGGSMYVSSGGTAMYVMENGGYVYEDIEAIILFLPNEFSGYTYSNGNNATIHSMTIGTDLTVGSAGVIDVYFSGTAQNTTVNESGTLQVYSSGKANSTTVNSSGRITVYQGGVANDTTVNPAGIMFVSSGGLADTTTVNAGGHVYDYGSARYTTVNSGGHLIVRSDAAAGATTVNSGGTMRISSGGTANSITVNSGGWLSVSSGGTATQIMENGGYVSIINDKNVTFIPNVISGISVGYRVSLHSGTTVTDATIDGNGYMIVERGGSANSTTVNSYGNLIVYSGGSADTITVNSGGWLSVSSGGTATRVDWTPCVGKVQIADGAYVRFVSQYSGVYYGADDQLLSNARYMVSKTVSVDAHGVRTSMYVMTDGLASCTTVNSGGSMYVSRGGLADTTTVNAEGYVYDYGSARYTTVNKDGMLVIYGDAAANSTTVNSGGSMRVYADGSASNTTVKSGGCITIFFGGSAVDTTTVNSGGSMIVYSGGTATGKMTFAKGAYVSFFDGANLDFDINIVSPDNDPFVNDLSLVQGAPTYTLTVAGTEELGDYKLAEGAAGFDKTITVVNVYGRALGTLTVGGTVTFNGSVYMLKLGDDNVLSVSVRAVDLTGDLTSSYVLPSGKVASSVNILSSGCLYVSNEAFADVVNVNPDGVVCVFNGGKASRTTVNSKGMAIVTRGGEADVVNVNFSGYLNVSSGGTATQIMENGGCVELENGAIATFVPHEFSGFVNSDANSWTTVHSGTTATGTTVGGQLRVYQGGIAKNTTLISGGCLAVSSGALATGATVDFGGRIDVNSGGKLTGKLKFEAGATVHAASGAILDFDLTQTAPGQNAFVNNLSPVLVEPFSYTLTVSGTEAEGNYRLAEGATGFQKTITVVNTSGTTLGTLTVTGGKKTISGQDYTLTLNGGSLAVKVGAVDLTGDLTSSYRISSGMVASSVNILDDGSLSINKDGFAENTTVNSQGELNVSSGGKASGVTITSGGKATVYAGGSATGIVAEDGACLGVAVAPGTYAKGTYAGSAFEVTSTVTGFAIHSGCALDVSDGGSASSINVKREGWLNVEGGKASDVTVISGGRAIVYGGSATGIVAEDGAFLSFLVAPGTYAKGTYAGSAFEIDSRVSGYTVHSGVLAVFEGGKAEAVTVNIGGQLVVDEGGSATQIRENGGAVLLEKGARYSFVSNTFTGVHVSGMHSATAHSGTTAVDTTVGIEGELAVFSGGVASGITVASKGQLVVSGGGKMTGKMTFETGASVIARDGAILDFDLRRTTVGADALLNDYRFVGSDLSFTLTVDGTLSHGRYKLANMVETFTKTIAVLDGEGADLGTLEVGQTANIGGVDYTLNLGNDNVLSVLVGAAAPTGPAKSDIDGNGVSDVMFVWTGEHGDGNYQHGYWMNGTSEWQSQNASHPAEWDNLGCYDMSGDGKADSVLVGNVVVNEVKGAYIGYYADAIDNPDGSTWVNIGYLNNADDIAWKNAVGNLTGNASGANSIVWYAAELNALGAWIDGTDAWASISNDFGGAWKLIGCGDFSGDGRDQIVMSLNGGEVYYEIALDGAQSELGASDSGWEVRAIGDFSGDGKDDIVAFHRETGLVAMWGDGKSANWSKLGQLDANDWFVVGAGDYNGDAQDDLLVRQYSTGMLGYYSSGDMANWNTLGYGVDMSWTVIA